MRYCLCKRNGHKTKEVDKEDNLYGFLIFVWVCLMLSGCGSKPNANSGLNSGSDAGLTTSADNNTPAPASDGHFGDEEMKAILEKISKDYDAGLLQERGYEDIRDSYFSGIDDELYGETDTASQ